MKQSPFVWLGSGRAKKRGVGAAGVLLDQAARAGLPVPRGGILLDEFYLAALDAGLVEVQQSQVVATDPDWLHETIYQQVRFPRLDKLVAVRAVLSADVENIPARPDVDFNDPIQLAASLCEAWSLDCQVSSRRDVFVTEMVAAQMSGVSVSQQTSENDLVQLSSGDSLALPKLQVWQRPAAHTPAYARRLQQLLRGLRRTFGPGNWEVEWADDNRVCWLLHVCPVHHPS